MKLPLISIGIPTYNRPVSLMKLIKCLLNQTYTNIEIVISDNASTIENSEQILKIIEEKDNRIKVFRQNENIGMVKNFEFVEKNSNGDFFMWFSDDDYTYDENFISILYNSLMESNSHFCFPNCFFKNEVNAFQNKYNNCNSKSDFILNYLSFDYMGYEFYGLYNRKLIKENGWKFEFLNIENATDIHYLLKLFLENKIYYTNKTSYVFNHQPNKYSNNRKKRHVEDHIYAYEQCLKEICMTDLINNNDKLYILDKILKKYNRLIETKYNLPFIKLIKKKIYNKLNRSLND